VSVRSRAIEERVADELQRWLARAESLAPPLFRARSADIARDVGVAFALEYVDAVAIGLTGPVGHDGRAPLVALSRLRIVTPPFPDLADGPEELGAPPPTGEFRFGIWLRPTDRGRAADVRHFLSLLRLAWDVQALGQRVYTTRPFRSLERITIDEELSMIREGYGDDNA
jgi:hypothetical protein